MGETDDKDIVPAETPTNEVEEPKETEKLLSPDTKKDDIEHLNGVKIDEEDETPAEETKKTNGEEIINIPESVPKESEIREVKSRKITIPPIKLPAFLKKNKSKPAADGAEGELLENAGNEAKADEQDKEKDGEDKEPAPAAPSKLAFLTNIKFTNPFAKKAPEAKPEETEENKEGKRSMIRLKYLI